MEKRLKVLVSAYACESGKGSEPGMGWNWVMQIARFHDVWVMTRESNKKSIEQEEISKLVNVHWSYIDLPKKIRFWKKGQRGVYIYYILWQICAFFNARKLHKKVNFDLVHHTTFGNYWLPSFLSFLHIPFVWGPLGGGESTPKTFWNMLDSRGKIYETFRDIARGLAYLNPLLSFSNCHADVAIAVTDDTAKKLSKFGYRNIKVYSGVALPKEEINKLLEMPSRQNGPFRFVSIGRMLHWKGFNLGLLAYAGFLKQFPSSEYWLIGNGPELNNLKSLAEKLKISNNVKFFEELPREQVLNKLAESNVLVHPSLHDSGGWVCLEAMACGKPVICLDLGGPAVQVTEETGFKIVAKSPEQAVNDLSNAMFQLARDFNLNRDMGEAGRKRVKKYFDWDRKGDWANKIYQELVV